MTYRESQKGMIALIAVMLVASFLLVAGMSTALLSSDELATTYTWLVTAKTGTGTHACSDNILALIRNNTSLSGNVNISLGNTTCVGTISGAGNTRVITAGSTSTDPFGSEVSYRVNINVNINTNPFTIIQYKDILR